MIEIIGSHDKERRAAKLERIRERNVTLDADLMSQVGSIIDDVRGRGDAALIDYAARFDGYVMQASELRVGEEELLRIASNVDANVLEALREASVTSGAFMNMSGKSRGRLKPNTVFGWASASRRSSVLDCMFRAGPPAIHLR